MCGSQTHGIYSNLIIHLITLPILNLQFGKLALREKKTQCVFLKINLLWSPDNFLRASLTRVREMRLLNDRHQGVMKCRPPQPSVTRWRTRRHFPSPGPGLFLPPITLTASLCRLTPSASCVPVLRRSQSSVTFLSPDPLIYVWSPPHLRSSVLLTLTWETASLQLSRFQL